MKFRELTKTSRLNEGKGKFEMETFDGGDEDENLIQVSTTIEYKDNMYNHRGYDTIIYISVILDPNDTNLDLYFGEDVYCSIEGYDRDARDYADKIFDKIFKMKTAKEVISYLKSL